ncbi:MULTISPECIES: M56 family metallopeptidase [unclassified Myroides]|uniref:M56 family metallopeptidase n=1 Tax=unclassified Myroides TaxID=2642485 RepID=UPI003D2F569E
MLLYLIQTTLLLLLTLGIYKLFLEPIKIHAFKRYYLLSALVLAFSLPLVKIPSTGAFTVANTKLQELNEVIITPVATENEPTTLASWTGSDVLLLVYFLGVSLFLIRFLLSLRSFHHLDKQGSIVYNRGQKFVLVGHLDAAFTFRKTIYLPLHIPIDWNNKILLHEYNHVKQNHSADILFIELLKIVCWFQPLLYWYQQHIALNHEFLADDALNSTKEETQAYLQLLLKQTFQQNELPLSSSFNFNLTKKRFTMLTKTNNPLQNTLAILGTTTLLLLLGATTVFAQSTVKETETVAPATPTNDPDEVYISVSEPANYPGGMQAFNQSFISNFRTPEFEGTSIRVIIMFIVEKDGSLSDIKVVKDPGYGVGEAAIAAITQMDKWIPAKEKGQVVRSQFALPITIQGTPTNKKA